MNLPILSEAGSIGIIRGHVFKVDEARINDPKITCSYGRNKVCRKRPRRFCPQCIEHACGEHARKGTCSRCGYPDAWIMAWYPGEEPLVAVVGFKHAKGANVQGWRTVPEPTKQGDRT